MLKSYELAGDPMYVFAMVTGIMCLLVGWIAFLRNWIKDRYALVVMGVGLGTAVASFVSHAPPGYWAGGSIYVLAMVAGIMSVIVGYTAFLQEWIKDRYAGAVMAVGFGTVVASYLVHAQPL